MLNFFDKSSPSRSDITAGTIDNPVGLFLNNEGSGVCNLYYAGGDMYGGLLYCYVNDGDGTSWTAEEIDGSGDIHDRYSAREK